MRWDEPLVASRHARPFQLNVSAARAPPHPALGRDITGFVQQLMRDRKEPVPSVQSLEVAKRIKEMHCYTCPDLVKEFAK